MRDFVVLLGVGNVCGPASSAPVLVRVKEGNVFEATDGSAINDSLPVVHPGDLFIVLEQLGVSRSSDAVVLLGESKTTFASRGSLGGHSLRHSRESSKAQKENGFDRHLENE